MMVTNNFNRDKKMNDGHENYHDNDKNGENNQTILKIIILIMSIICKHINPINRIRQDDRLIHEYSHGMGIWQIIR